MWMVETQLCKLRGTSDIYTNYRSPVFYVLLANGHPFRYPRRTPWALVVCRWSSRHSLSWLPNRVVLWSTRQRTVYRLHSPSTIYNSRLALLSRCCCHHDEPNSDRGCRKKRNRDTALHHTKICGGGQKCNFYFFLRTSTILSTRVTFLVIQELFCTVPFGGSYSEPKGNSS